MTTADPMDVIVRPPPSLAAAEALEIAATHFGLPAVEARPLVSERDQNFRLRTAGGEEYVLKIANAAEDPAVTGFQVQALRHIAATREPCPPVPRVMPTVSGASSFMLRHDGDEHVVRLVTYLPGRPLADGGVNPVLSRALGVALAQLGRALKGFDHPQPAQTLLWDMKQAGRARTLLPEVPDDALRGLLADCLDDFEARALPRFGTLRSQVIHSDLHSDNVLVDVREPDRVAGIIDFGDMQRSPLIVDVAVACAYLRRDDGDPLALIAEFVAGYHSVTALTLEEIDLLRDLIATRLATTLLILAWRMARRTGDDPYLDESLAGEQAAGPFLKRLREMPRELVARRLREVCASVTEQAGQRAPSRYDRPSPTGC
ncbi:MAG: phosphotransferase [Woeseiaceae bacterium]|nr:phosphotransferase [Woeseiaceae bacterium]